MRRTDGLVGVEGEGEDERKGDGEGDGELSGRSNVLLRETVDCAGAGDGEGEGA